MNEPLTASPIRVPLNLPSAGGLRQCLPRFFQTVAERAGLPTGAGNPALDALMGRLAGLPARAALLGSCPDGLPVLLDLADPSPGALLVAADERAQRQALLRTLLYSAAALNSPRSVQLLVLSSQPLEWQPWLGDPRFARHSLGVEELGGPGGERWIARLSTWADRRRNAGADGPAVLLVVDDLPAVALMGYEARVNFDWLVKEGPAAKIWPVAAAASEALPGLSRWVSLFKSRILGPTSDPSVYRQAAGPAIDDLPAVELPGQFAVRIHDAWLTFCLPE